MSEATPTAPAQTPEQRLTQLRNEVKRARNWAGDNLPPKSGLALIDQLEKALAASR